MKFEIQSLKGVGILCFGMTVDETRKALAAPFKSFKRTPDSIYPSDHFSGLNIFAYYGQDGLEAVEIASPSQAVYRDKNLLALRYCDLVSLLQSDDDTLTLDDDGCTSSLLGIGAYAPQASKNAEACPESIIVFVKGYYD